MATQATLGKIEKLELKLKQAKALAQKQDAIARHKDLLKLGEESRREETRKKILLGAYVISRMPDVTIFGKDDEARGIGISFESWLQRDDERALFGFQPRQQQQ